MKNETIIEDMPKLESPFVRKEINGAYVVTPEVTPGYEWVFEDEAVMAIEKLHGTNVSVLIEHGQITRIFNRTEALPFFNRGKRHIIEGILEAYDRGFIDKLTDGQWFGELIGPKVNGNPYCLDKHLWIPFRTYARKHLMYKSWGKYLKDYATISAWFEKDLMPLYALSVHGKARLDSDPTLAFVEGVVFTHPDGRMAKLRRDMFPWFKGNRHKGVMYE